MVQSDQPHTEPAPPPNEVEARVQQFNRMSEDIVARKQKLEAGMNGYNWEELRRSNPQQFAELARQVRETQAGIDRDEKALANYRPQLEGWLGQMEVEQKQAVNERENKKLLDMLPDWRDEAKRNEESEAIRAYAYSRGYDDNDLEALTASDVVLLRDAWIGYSNRTPTGIGSPPNTRRYGSSPMAQAEAEIERRHMNPNSMEAAALKISALLG